MQFLYHRTLEQVVKSLVAIALSVSLCFFASSGSLALAATGRAVIQGTSESADVTGEVYFTETEAGLHIQAELTNAPRGQHGFHIHEFGSCADAGRAAGGHFNPEQVKHGYLPADGFERAHAGDLGNIDVEQGSATYTATLAGLALTGGDYPIAGRAVIVHEEPDDFGQPTGHAGGRLGCGTIMLAASEAEAN